jgi:hypothetical protein
MRRDIIKSEPSDRLKPMRYVIYLLIFCGLAVSTGAETNIISVHGYIHYQSFVSGGLAASESRPFEISLQGDSWYLRTVPPNKFVPEIHISYDNKKNTLFGLLQERKNLAIATLTTIEVPHFLEEPMAAPIWLTYASGRFFREDKEKTMYPPVTTDIAGGYPLLRLAPFRLPYVFEELSMSGGLPKRLLCFENAKTNRVNGTKYPFPFDSSGFTSVVYRVTQVTNFGTLSIPLEAELDIFGIRPSSGKLERLSHYTVMTTNVSSVFGELRREPQLLGSATMYDYRTTERVRSKALCYESSRWLSPDEAKRQPKLGKPPFLFWR